MVTLLDMLDQQDPEKRRKMAWEKALQDLGTAGHPMSISPLGILYRTYRDGPGALQSMWETIKTPGDIAAGKKPATVEDAAKFALDVGLVSAPIRAPRGSLRMGSANSYRGMHTAPGRANFADEAAASLDDLTRVFPDDIYGPNGLRYYGHGGNHAAMDRESMRQILAARGRPDKMVTVYRAVPNDVTDINAGDWVTLSRKYAEEHALGQLDGGKVISKKVRASDLFNDANSINEFGWDPKK